MICQRCDKPLQIQPPDRSKVLGGQQTVVHEHSQRTCCDSAYRLAAAAIKPVIAEGAEETGACLQACDEAADKSKTETTGPAASPAGDTPLTIEELKAAEDSMMADIIPNQFPNSEIPGYLFPVIQKERAYRIRADARIAKLEDELVAYQERPVGCAWCAAKFPQEKTYIETMKMMASHMLVCEKHPYPKAFGELQEAQAELKAAHEEAKEFAAVAAADHDKLEASLTSANLELSDFRLNCAATAKVIEAGEKEILKLNAELKAAREEARECSEQLEFDRTGMADCVTRIETVLKSRFWLTEGRGPYEWDDDDYRKEFGWAIKEIHDSLQPVLRLAGDLKHAPVKSEEVAASRIDLKRTLATYKEALRRAAEAEARRDDSTMYQLPQATQKIMQRWLTQSNPQATKTP